MNNEVGLEKSALDTPVLWVDLDQLEQNITRLAAHFAQAGVQWRRQKSWPQQAFGIFSSRTRL